MKRLASVIAVVVIVAALSLAVLAGGCGSVGNPAILPVDGDTIPEVEEAFISTALDAAGQAVAGAGVITPDTPVIYLYFDLAKDLCCQTVTVQWWHGGEVINSWSETDSTDGVFTVALPQPDGGFSAGVYSVRVYILIEELIHLDFTIE